MNAMAASAAEISVPASDIAAEGGKWKWILAIGLLIPTILVLPGWTIAPPILNPDSAMGFLVWQSRGAGVAWNHLQTVDPADISRNSSAFLSWWSPGQYEVPGLFRQLGFTWGHAMLLTALTGSWIGTAGAWLLARDIGGSRMVAATFCTLSALEWHSLYGFGQFCGGDILLYAAAPWTLLWAWRGRGRPWLFTTTVPAVMLAGFFLKLSSGLFTLPIFALAGLSAGYRLRHRRGMLALWALATAVVAVLAWCIVRFGYLDRSPNPGNFDQVHRTLAAALSFSALAPWFAATGGQSFVGRILWHFHRESSGFWESPGALEVLVAAGVWGVGLGWLWRTHQRLLRIAVTFLIATAAALLALLVWRGANIGLEDRFLRPVATVLLLALAVDLEAPQQARRYTAVMTILLIAGFGTAAAAQRTWRLAAMHQGGTENLTQQQLSPSAIAECSHIDTATRPGTAVVYVPSPEIAFNFPRQRVLATGDANELRIEPRHGRVSRLVVLASDAMEADGRSAAVRKSFLSYRENEWRGEHRAGWWFWTAEKSEPQP